MKKFCCSLLFILLSTQTIFAGSLVDSIAGKIFDSIGGTALEQKAKEFEQLIPKLENWKNALEAIDIDDLTGKMMRRAFEIYKEYGCPYVPSNYQNMTFEELNKYNDEHSEEIAKWVESLSQATQDEMNEKAKDIVTMANPVMEVAESGMPILNEMQGKMTEIEPLLDNYVNGYKNFMKSYEDGTLDLSKYPEWQQAMDLMKPMAEAYAKGDKIQAFKYLDDITGLFSNSDAGKGLKILIQAADSVGLSKYVVKIVRGLLKFNGTSDQLAGISDAQMEQAINEYIQEIKKKTGIKNDDTHADAIKGMVEDYVGKIDSAEKTKEALGKLADSPVGDFIKKQLEGKSVDALTDVMSKYSGVDKQTIKNSGIEGLIKDTADAVGKAGTGEMSWIGVAKNAVSKLFGILKGKV